MLHQPTESLLLKNAGRRFAGLLSGEEIEDEVGVVDSLFMSGLRSGHEVGVDFGTAFGSCPPDDLSITTNARAANSPLLLWAGMSGLLMKCRANGIPHDIEPEAVPRRDDR